MPTVKNLKDILDKCDDNAFVWLKFYTEDEEGNVEVCSAALTTFSQNEDGVELGYDRSQPLAIGHIPPGGD